MRYALILTLLLSACGKKNDEEPQSSRKLFSSWSYQGSSDTLDLSNGPAMATPFIAVFSQASPPLNCSCAAYFMGYETSGTVSLASCLPSVACASVNDSYTYTFDGGHLRMCSYSTALCTTLD